MKMHPRRRYGKKLATVTAQGIHLQPALGPGFQQECAADAADGQLLWFGSVEEEVEHHHEARSSSGKNDKRNQRTSTYTIPKK